MGKLGGWAAGNRPRGLRESTAGRGVVVVSSGSGRYELVEGRRRCKAIAQLAGEDRWPAPAQVEALILDAAKPVRREVRGGLALALHATRSASPASELREIEAILKSGATDGEVSTVKETVRRRLRLRSLAPALQAAVDDGRITPSVAEAAARLPEPEQQTLAAQLAERSRLTLPDVSELAWRRSDEVKARLPGELFCDRELPWQTTVRGHLLAALGAIPADKGRGEVMRLLERALTSSERAWGGLGGPRVGAAGKPVLTLLPLSFLCLRSIQHV